jgi:hypothetical protein
MTKQDLLQQCKSMASRLKSILPDGLLASLPLVDPGLIGSFEPNNSMHEMEEYNKGDDIDTRALQAALALLKRRPSESREEYDVRRIRAELGDLGIVGPRCIHDGEGGRCDFKDPLNLAQSLEPLFR